MNTRSRLLHVLQNQPDILRTLRRGIEKEGLRVDTSAHLSQRPHPVALGSALTNEHITTDYSEALLELITGTHHDVASLLDELEAIHIFTAQGIDTETMWNQSMPAILPSEKDIPIAWYGKSNVGMMKHIYRRGLAERYGKRMQCIAGIHYNFSLPDTLWPLMGFEGLDLQEQRSTGYLALIRNFTRYSWLLMYLFGASPVVSSGFLKGHSLALEQVAPDSYTLPWATSLRMSDLGYQNKEAQAELQLCYNDLDTFLMRMLHATRTPWPDYERLGTHRDGEWIQLNTNILQIENEYYSNIRPKRTTQSGERPSAALAQRGVEYVEVRCLDIDPYAPLGISEQSCHFLDTFLLFCTLESSDEFPNNGFCQHSKNNFAQVVREGRKPGLILNTPEHGSISLQDWGNQLLEAMAPYADLLDQHLQSGHAHRDALHAQIHKLRDPDNTPSARLLRDLSASGLSFVDFSLKQSQAHRQHLLDTALCPKRQAAYEQAATDSLTLQANIESAQANQSFEDYLSSFETNS
ncbi:glutamate--cysteine ligase [Paenalcaligenes sp. Me52]|uniref:glutamate--cysteine ligase n=1 Tax=Paenalcaligenes sp. Me52 TaxID=3392038 RepID=UPI003D2E249F